MDVQMRCNESSSMSLTEISCNRWERHAKLTISVAMSHIDVQISTPRGLCREANVQVGDIEQCVEQCDIEQCVEE